MKASVFLGILMVGVPASAQEWSLGFELEPVSKAVYR